MAILKLGLENKKGVEKVNPDVKNLNFKCLNVFKF